MNKKKQTKKIIIIAVCLGIILLIIGANVEIPKTGIWPWYRDKPVYSYEKNQFGRTLNVDDVLYSNATKTSGWLVRPEHYGEVIGYMNYSDIIYKIGLVQGYPDREFLYIEPEEGENGGVKELYVKNGVELDGVGSETVSRIEYHPPDGNPNTWKSAQEKVDHITTDPAIIHAFFENLFDPAHVYDRGSGLAFTTDIAGLYLYSDQYPAFYVPDMKLYRAKDNRYFIFDCPLRWLTEYGGRFSVEISADVMEALIGGGTLQ